MEPCNGTTQLHGSIDNIMKKKCDVLHELQTFSKGNVVVLGLFGH